MILNEKEFIDSEKECAGMLGMSLLEYQDYHNNLNFELNNKKLKKKKEH